jgi:hypothetical protein
MANTMLSGKYRLVHRDNRDNSLGEIIEIHSQTFGGVTGTPRSDPQQMPKVKKNHSRILRQDDKLVIMFQPTTTVTEHSTSGAAVNTIKIPVTINNIRSGFVYETELTVADFTDKRPYANSQAWTAAAWYDIWSLTIGAQLEVKVGHNLQDVRVDSALNIQKDVVTS